MFFSKKERFSEKDLIFRGGLTFKTVGPWLGLFVERFEIMLVLITVVRKKKNLISEEGCCS